MIDFLIGLYIGIGVPVTLIYGLGCVLGDEIGMLLFTPLVPFFWPIALWYIMRNK